MRRRLVRGIIVIAAIISALFLNDLMKTRREKKLADPSSEQLFDPIPERTQAGM